MSEEEEEEASDMTDDDDDEDDVEDGYDDDDDDGDTEALLEAALRQQLAKQFEVRFRLDMGVLCCSSCLCTTFLILILSFILDLTNIVNEKGPNRTFFFKFVSFLQITYLL